ncbi:DNA (cytosine-5-)-methyltransferase [Streptomyces tateyamensis]|uniref:Cytosine-specific methyltransferase n=2 Tax=Streptomyces tateyamensis TaxID=565073 RepID=A0A2V4N818_9ACTN|nr:DNA (cytosine-5-)-methyltransferase [Streptomyces tateyamensis]
MPTTEPDERFEVVEICAGAGGQSLGLGRAGFHHRLAVELDANAANTLRHNLPNGDEVVRVGDVADLSVWNPSDHKGVDLLAGGVPCPPFSIAGKQLGANDERDLFAWAVETCGIVKPKALLLENVRGLSANRFSAYRQHVLDQLHEYGYVGEWKLLQANDFGVSQLRPRFVLVALQREFAPYFSWPEPNATKPPTVGELLKDLMGQNGWPTEQWVLTANDIAPTIVGGSKKHGGADLGPTRAKRAWKDLGVDAMGVANEAPGPDFPVDGHPKLTTEMVARIQGWDDDDFKWEFKGRKTTVYRQIGNAFPPPVARALGEAIKKALGKTGEPRVLPEATAAVQDPVYRLLRGNTRPLTVDQMIAKLAKTGTVMEQPEVERHLNHLNRDFEMTMTERSNGAIAYLLGEFKAFIGQDGHQRHDLFTQHRAKIS